jgi:crossover junction endodeoxyribonuclease RusA
MPLQLPYPVSTNRMYRVYRGRPHLSPEAKAYKDHVAWLAAFSKVKMLHGPIGMSILVQPKLTKKGVVSEQQIDLSNCVKVAEDALQGVWFVNDKQVRKLTLDIADHGIVGGGMMVDVWPLAAGTPA